MAPNYQISLWIGGGLEALPDGLQYLKSYVDWRAATDPTMTAPPLMQVWLPEGDVELPAGMTVGTGPPPLSFHAIPSPPKSYGHLCVEVKSTGADAVHLLLRGNTYPLRHVLDDPMSPTNMALETVADGNYVRTAGPVVEAKLPPFLQLLGRTFFKVLLDANDPAMPQWAVRAFAAFVDA